MASMYGVTGTELICFGKQCVVLFSQGYCSSDKVNLNHLIGK